VDDHEDSLEGFSIILGDRYDVFGYASPVDALQAIATVRPDVVVLDIGMQPVDGMKCLAMIRATPGYRDTPAVALTGFARDVERQRFLAAGFQAIVVKPVVDFGKLTAAIDRLANAAAAQHLDDPVAITASERGGARGTDAA